ncbi:MAG TPA: nucleotide pyrophosphohydrolase [Humisphaera sp.]|jgi:NTP pyrophosphatase (non-canonical NTP hydrolase)|nr:nucleotide pyrophosphohydrolase [Humisphaera sp.]
MNPEDLSDLTRRVLHHRDQRDWAQFHTPKELAVSLCVEAAELLSLMQWKTGEDLQQHLANKRTQLQDELGDVLHSLLLLANDLKIDLSQALIEKLAKDNLKYPIEKSRGQAKKYDEL